MSNKQNEEIGPGRSMDLHGPARPWVWPCVFFGLAIVLAACAAPGAPAELSGSAANLEGSKWVLSSLNGNNPVPGSNFTLEFTGDEFGGMACNHYGGKYTAANDGSLSLTEVTSTLMFCSDPEGVMEQETAFFQALEKAAAYRITGDRLEIMNAAGDNTLLFTKKEQSQG